MHEGSRNTDQMFVESMFFLTNGGNRRKTSAFFFSESVAFLIAFALYLSVWKEREPVAFSRQQEFVPARLQAFFYSFVGLLWRRDAR